MHFYSRHKAEELSRLVWILFWNLKCILITRQSKTFVNIFHFSVLNNSKKYIFRYVKREENGTSVSVSFFHLLQSYSYFRKKVLQQAWQKIVDICEFDLVWRETIVGIFSLVSRYSESSIQFQYKFVRMFASKQAKKLFSFIALWLYQLLFRVKDILLHYLHFIQAFLVFNAGWKVI